MSQRETLDSEAQQTGQTGQTEQTEPAPAAAEPTPAPAGSRSMESKFPRGLVIRLIAYLFVGHLFAFFVYLLFVLGARNQ